MFNADSKGAAEEYCDEGAGDVDDDGSVSKLQERKAFYVNKSNGWKLVASAMTQLGAGPETLRPQPLEHR